MAEMQEPSSFTSREIRGQPSQDRTGYLKKRYLEAPLRVDIEYIDLLTRSHQKTDGLELLERRAENHAYAIENLTPVILDGERIVAAKTRYIRGAIPYTNYAAAPFLCEMHSQQQDAQQRHIDQGDGGGFATARREAEGHDLEVFSGKFLISRKDRARLEEICEYWKDRSMMAVGDRLWKKHFPHASFIEDGWEIGLYTAPHDPCPEGRLILDFDLALERGYLSLIEDLNEKILNFEPTAIHEAQKLHFWRAARRTLEAGIRFAERYAEEALRLAACESNEHRRVELEQIAETCRHVPAHPPRCFAEAMQSYWFTYLLGHIEGAHLGFSPGRLDRWLAPYFERDPDASFNDAVELFEELFVKMTQIEYIASMSWQGLGHGNLYQNCILGGEDENGLAADNELSLAILQAQINMQLTQPTLSIWWTEHLSQAFLLKAAECVKTGVGYPAFFNLKTYLEHEKKVSGLPIEVLRRHAAMGGCTEPVLQGLSYGVVQAGFVNHGKLIELTVHDGRDPISGKRLFEPCSPSSFDEVYASYIQKMHASVRHWQKYWNYVMLAHRQTVPLVFCSAFVNDCIKRGRSMDDGGARHNATPTTLSSGMVNVANSLAAIRSICFEEKLCNLKELGQILDRNWEGHADLRKKALQAPKWGNDDDRVDLLFADLFMDYCTWVRQQNNYLGAPYDPSMLAISTPVPFGKACGAFPDGRLAGAPLADGVTSPHPGTDRLGPTAVIRSSAKIDHTQIRGGLLNLKFHPSALSGKNGSSNLLALVKTYFERPGFHVQFNVVDSQMLRHAQKSPDNYRDLVVRVAGFSAYWVEMSKALQDQVISRTEHNL